MARTRTGNFPIGFRRGGSDWQKNLSSLIGFAQAHGFEGVDLGSPQLEDVRLVLDAGLQVGTVDLPQPWGGLASPDAGRRKESAEKAAAAMREMTSAGVHQFFCVMFPEDHGRNRSENLDFAIDGYGRLCQAVEETGARILLEGWPGPGPHHAALGCTPADLRLIFSEIGSDVMGVNYDPSHLLRMGIDPIHFAREFAPRIGHVHGKDTEILDEGLYEHGHLQAATRAPGRGFGGVAWRYTIPGHGATRWTAILEILVESGYRGMMSIELEDENFNGSEEGEKRGLIASHDFLAHV